MEEQLIIKENSWLAKLAARKLGATSAAIVVGNTIHIYNVTTYEFLQNKKWVKHEVCHLQQFKKHGRFLFILKYLWQSARHGYYNNKYEAEARNAEND